VRPYLEKILHRKRAGGMAQDVGPEFKPQCWEEKKKKKNHRVTAGFSPYHLGAWSCH
jgi:hypothetical protein